MIAQGVANTVWALATFGWQAGEGTMRALEGAVVRLAPSMNAQDVANTVWGLATLGWQASEEWAGRFAASVEALLAAPERFSKSGLMQLLRAHLASELLGLHLISLPKVILQAAQTAHRESLPDAGMSRGHREVGECLNRLGIAHEREHTASDGLPPVDLALLDRRIAIEFDGPSHFARNTCQPLGHTRLRDRLLSATGWHVVSIPFFEWDKLRRHDDRDAYVRQRLETPPIVAHAIRAPMTPPSHGPASSTARSGPPSMAPTPAVLDRRGRLSIELQAALEDAQPRRASPPSHPRIRALPASSTKPAAPRVPERTSATSAVGTTAEETAEVRIREDGGPLAVVASSGTASAPTPVATSAGVFDPLAPHAVRKRDGKCRTYVAGSAAFLRHWSSGAIQRDASSGELYFVSNEGP
jgi:hypothetical protein